MTLMPLVYVIVLNFEGWRDTLGCIRAVERLRYGNWRLVVVDNGSRDGSPIQLRAAVPHLRLLELERNRGFAGGNNEGIRLALNEGAEYVWLLNNDTKPMPDALLHMVDVAESNTRIGAVGSVLVYMNDTSRVQGWGGGRIHMWLGVCRHFRGPVPVSRVDYLTGASLLIRAAALRDVGLLDDRYFMYWEDADFSFRLREHGWAIAVASAACVLHGESTSLGRTSPEYDRHYSTSAVRFFKRHASIPVVPIAMGTLARFGQRVAHGQWARARAVLSGVVQAYGCA